jgi:uncharacterized protein (DUF362 family)
MAKVSLNRCGSYDGNEIRKTIIKIFDDLGGIDRFIKPGEKVLIKPNLICPKTPDKPAQTHPSIIYETARLAVEAHARVTVADSPAWSDTRNCLKALGIDSKLDKLGVAIRDLDNPQKTRLPLTGLNAGISTTALEADKIINLAKLKAHQQMVATIAVKNMFGAVSGKSKALWHYRKGNSTEEFASMLLGVFLRVKPAINIVDAVIAMDGQGPINGNPRPVAMLLGSEDAIACEMVCCRIIAMDEAALPIIRAGRIHSVGCGNFKDIEIMGEDIEDCICREFVHAIPVPLKFSLPRICRSAARQLWILSRIKGKGIRDKG